MAQKGVLTTADYLPLHDFKSLIESLRNDKRYVWELYCRLSFYLALRSTNVRYLKWKEILDKDCLYIMEGKTKKVREIPFKEPAQRKIAELYNLMGNPDLDDYSFRSTKFETPYSIQYMNRILKQFRFDYKLPVKAFSTDTLG